jgi:hypothetical protein
VIFVGTGRQVASIAVSRAHKTLPYRQGLAVEGLLNPADVRRPHAYQDTVSQCAVDRGHRMEPIFEGLSLSHKPM